MYDWRGPWDAGPAGWVGIFIILWVVVWLLVPGGKPK